jgi:threonine dehydrogenase-like Zn-dependent dehydrogenase
VVGEINASCHQCPTCRSGRPSHCENRTVLGISGRDGAFAEYLTLPLRNLHRVPAEVTDEQAVFCEPLAAALEILEQVHVQPTDHVLLVGAGRLGQLVAQVLQLTGCRLEVVARHPRQGEILKTRGIRVIPPNAVAPTAADVAIEATGSPDGFTLARRAIRPRGTIVLKSTYATDALLDLSSLVVDEITLVGSRCGPFAPALRLLAEGLVSVEPLVHARHHLSRGVEAFSEAARPGALKIILEVTT